MCCETWGVCICTSVMSNHIMNTHLTNSSLVKSQIQRLNPFIINHFSSFCLIIWKEINVNELWLEYFSSLKMVKHWQENFSRQQTGMTDHYRPSEHETNKSGKTQTGFRGLLMLLILMRQQYMHFKTNGTSLYPCWPWHRRRFALHNKTETFSLTMLRQLMTLYSTQVNMSAHPTKVTSWKTTVNLHSSSHPKIYY